MCLKRHRQVSRVIKGISIRESAHCATLVLLKAIQFFVLEFQSDFNLKCLTGCSVLVTFARLSSLFSCKTGFICDSFLLRDAPRAGLGQRQGCRPGSYFMLVDWQGGQVLQEMCGHWLG